ncbi:MAG TPA: glycosyltransferase family 39 protein [Thermoanaerobaculaceae bacterium]|nr:glycosyltransferase family 39 protein [Thermoanaerobaculaceae bacterium]
MPRPRVATLGLLLLAMVPALAALDSRAFFSPDETSYAEVAREMAASGDLVVPRIDGRPWLEKPPLVYWLLAAAFALNGWGFGAAVLLNALLTAATALVLAAHVRRSGSPRAAALAGLAYLTMFLPLATARSALTDPALTLCTTAAIALFASERRWTAAAAGACLGLGILAKGPIAPLVVLPAAGVLAFAARRRGGWRRLGAALAVALAVALPWHALLAARGLLGEFGAVFLGRQVVARAVQSWGTDQTAWFYLPVLWVAAFPWGAHLVLALREWWRGASGGEGPRWERIAEAAAVAVPLLVFSLSINKLPHYLLPVLPWLAAWLGRAADGLLAKGGRDPGARAVGAGGAAVAAVVVGVLPWSLAHGSLARMLAPIPRAWFVAAAAAILFCGALEWAGARRSAWAGLAIVALAMRGAIDLRLLPALDRQSVERPLAEAVRRELPAGGLAIAHRWWRSSFVAYGVRGWRRTSDAAELDAALADPARAGRATLVLVRADAEGEVRGAAWRRGGVAREVARIAGIGEIGGAVIEGVVFRVEADRDGRCWFYDAERRLAGETGFSSDEGNPWTPTFRWTTDLRASLPVPAAAPGPATLRLRAWGIERNHVRQRLHVSVNECTVGDLDLATVPGTFALPVPAGCALGGAQTLRFESRHLASPRLADWRSRDPRQLGFALDWVALDPATPEVDLTERLAGR